MRAYSWKRGCTWKRQCTWNSGADVFSRALVCGIEVGAGFTSSPVHVPGGSGEAKRLAPQERANPSLPRDLFKYSVRNNGI
jgi:hypothetical protein